LLFKKVKGAGLPAGFVSGSLEMANGDATVSAGTTGGRHADAGGAGGFAIS